SSPIYRTRRGIRQSLDSSFFYLFFASCFPCLRTAFRADVEKYGQMEQNATADATGKVQMPLRYKHPINN
ncbi:MAG: hypothetical protein ACI4WX_11570, partial [Aristaeellaceae bacterium]